MWPNQESMEFCRDISTELFPLIRSLLSQLPDKSGVMGELCRIIRDLGSGIVWGFKR